MMKNTTSNILRLAVAAAFAGATGSALAVVDLKASPAAPVKFASEITTAGTTLANTGNILDFTAKGTAFNPHAGLPLLINVNLTGASTFNGAPTATCSYNSGATVFTTGASITLGGNGTANVVFALSAISQATDPQQVTSCKILPSSLDIASGAHAAIRATITYKYGNPAIASSVASADLITWSNGISAAATDAGNLGTAQVITGFVTFKAAQGLVATAAGPISFKANANYNSGGTTPAVMNNYVSAGSVSITFAGNSIAAVSTGYVVAGGNNCVVGNAIGSGTVGGATITVAGLTNTQISAGVSFCAAFSGSTAIPGGAITAQLGAAGKATTNALITTFSGASTATIGTINRNGSATRVLNLPANVTGADAGYVRVTNNSAMAGKIYGTLYGQDGTVLGTANSLLSDSAKVTQATGQVSISSSKLVPNGVLVLDTPTLMSILGISSNWAGRAQLMISAETPSIRAQNLIRTANGTLVNVGGDTSGAGN